MFISNMQQKAFYIFLWPHLKHSNLFSKKANYKYSITLNCCSIDTWSKKNRTNTVTLHSHFCTFLNRNELLNNCSEFVTPPGPLLSIRIEKINQTNQSSKTQDKLLATYFNQNFQLTSTEIRVPTWYQAQHTP